MIIAFFIQQKSRPPAALPEHEPTPVCEFCVVTDGKLTDLGYQLRMCGADVHIMDVHSQSSETAQVNIIHFRQSVTCLFANQSANY